MSVTTILRGNEWPELKSFLKDASPKLTDFIYKGAPSVNGDETACWLETIDLPQGEASIVGDLVDYLFEFSLCRLIDQHKEEALSSFFYLYETIISHYSRFEKIKAR